ncbi:MAG: SDR family NAD(P)-dependent oxidoreductase [Clostridia bacterium]|nr:SDR family NAD(P)-dependent oxidoreductase [Clostridia bacterium]
MKKIAVVTGASGGIGRCFAKTLSCHGEYDEVWVIARSEAKLESLRSEIPYPLRVLSLDLSEDRAMGEYKAYLEAENPRVALLINCAGYGKFDAFEKLSYEENIGMIDLNCRALTALTYLSLPYMGEGSEIINIASVAAFQPIPYIGVYGASKAYVLSFSRALGREVDKRGIRVLAVCPFWTRTNFFDRAVNSEKQAVVKKYVAMYAPEYIVETTWRAMK